MTLKSCYTEFGGDYEDAMERLMSEKMLKKFVLKFPEDKSYETLCISCEKKNAEDAFRAAHTLKGICQNLGFTSLLESGGRLTEALRSKEFPDDLEELLEKVTRDYQQIISAILKLEKEG